MSDTYPAPEHGWTCFHCGECFTTHNEARDHFGMDGDIHATPACQIPAEHVRAELRRYRVVESALRGIANELLDIRSYGDGAPFLGRDHDRFYDLCTKALEVLSEGSVRLQVCFDDRRRETASSTPRNPGGSC